MFGVKHSLCLGENIVHTVSTGGKSRIKALKKGRYPVVTGAAKLIVHYPDSEC